MKTIKDKLIHAVTQYDRKQSTKRGYNPHALGIYFEWIDEVCADIERGAPIRESVMAGFNDRLLDVCLRALGLPACTEKEALNGPVCYTPSVETMIAERHAK